MKFSIFAAAALLLATTAVTTPLPRETVEVAVRADVEIEFSAEYENRMKESQAHKLYKQALRSWKKAQKNMWAILTLEGQEREERIMETSFVINEALNILVGAEQMNEQDAKYVRRHWVQYEINHLKDKLTDARFSVMKLPNLCFVAKAYDFTIHAAEEIVLDVVAAAVTVPVVTVQVLAEAAHKVHICLHRMKEELKWEVERIESCIKYVWEEFEDEVHKLGRKIRKEAHEIGVKIKCGLKNLGKLIVADFMDIRAKIKGAFHHHHEPSSSSSSSDEEYTIQDVVASGKVKVDIEIEWKVEEAKRRYKDHCGYVKKSEKEYHQDLGYQDKQVVSAKWY